MVDDIEQFQILEEKIDSLIDLISSLRKKNEYSGKSTIHQNISIGLKPEKLPYRSISRPLVLYPFGFLSLCLKS